MVPGLLRDLGLGEAAVAASIAEVWASVCAATVGEAGAAHTAPAGLRAGVLDVVVDSSAWSQQLQLRRTELLEELGRRFGDEAPRDLRLRVGR